MFQGFLKVMRINTLTILKVKNPIILRIRESPENGIMYDFHRIFGNGEVSAQKTPASSQVG